ncbi:hypothetical protein [Novosphingobium sp.]|uniref:hypothetical protein n=1 Tax=Novosphingobium sp. TaxID=1874826 RepID=UPI00286AECD5|nr:hypothetical protein [Novosphingobium sp.]
MTDPRSEQIETGLGRAAEALGDVTQPVMDLFYARYPGARASFVHHSPHNPASLEAEMVGNTLYYVMRWFENPVEARIYFDTSVPQHRVALGVPPDWYRGFIEAFLDVVEPAAAPATESEKAAWAAVRDGLVGLVERNRHI